MRLTQYTWQTLGNHLRVQRHDGKPVVCGWDTLQAIKNEAFGEDATVIEIFPAESDVVADANIRHF